MVFVYHFLVEYMASSINAMVTHCLRWADAPLMKPSAVSTVPFVWETQYLIWHAPHIMQLNILAASQCVISSLNATDGVLLRQVTQLSSSSSKG